MNHAVAGRLQSERPLKVLCSPYLIYTHQDILASLFAAMARKGWDVSVLLPFTSPETLATMAHDAAGLGVGSVRDFTSRRLVGGPARGALPRLLRALALLGYFVRALWLLLSWRPDALLLTSDLGGVSVRFVQLAASALGIRIFTLQSTLFLKVTEREDLKFEFRPAWLQRLLSRGLFKKLFLYFGEVPGSFLPHSHLGVQDDDIRRVCIEFGKKPEFIRVFGSLQAAKIRAAREASGGRKGLPRVLFLTECITERYGDELGLRNIEWMRRCAESLADRAAFSVRFHPREPDSYRQAFMAALGDMCRVDPAATAIDAAAGADIIIGAYSMLMFDAQAAGISTVFLDVGEDPLGFYNDRRVPMADSPDTLRLFTAQMLATPPVMASSAAASPEAWVGEILQWMSEVILVKEKNP